MTSAITIGDQGSFHCTLILLAAICLSSLGMVTSADPQSGAAQTVSCPVCDSAGDEYRKCYTAHQALQLTTACGRCGMKVTGVKNYTRSCEKKGKGSFSCSAPGVWSMTCNEATCKSIDMSTDIRIPALALTNKIKCHECTGSSTSDCAKGKTVTKTETNACVGCSAVVEPEDKYSRKCLTVEENGQSLCANGEHVTVCWEDSCNSEDLSGIKLTPIKNPQPPKETPSTKSGSGSSFNSMTSLCVLLIASLASLVMTYKH